MDICEHCKSDLGYEEDGCTYTRRIGVEYVYGSPNRYDGVSEWLCPECEVRVGRWTGKVLAEGEQEPRFGAAHA